MSSSLSSVAEVLSWFMFNVSAVSICYCARVMMLSLGLEIFYTYTNQRIFSQTGKWREHLPPPLLPKNIHTSQPPAINTPAASSLRSPAGHRAGTSVQQLMHQPAPSHLVFILLAFALYYHILCIIYCWSQRRQQPSSGAQQSNIHIYFLYDEFQLELHQKEIWLQPRLITSTRVRTCSIQCILDPTTGNRGTSPISTWSYDVRTITAFVVLLALLVRRKRVKIF